MATEEKVKMVVIVDDDESMRNALQGLMKEVGLAAQAFASAEDFLAFGRARQAGCVIADIRMPGMSGLELQARLKAEHCNIPIIFITGHGDEKMRLQAVRAGAVEFLSKPFDDEILLESVRAAMNNGTLRDVAQQAARRLCGSFATNRLQRPGIERAQVRANYRQQSRLGECARTASSRRRWGVLHSPTRERFFSTRSAIFRWRCSRSFCEFCRNRSSNAWAAAGLTR